MFETFFQERAATLVDLAFFYAPKIFWSIFVLAVFFLLAKISSRVVNRMMEKSPLDDLLNKFASATTAVVVFIIGIFIVFTILGWQKTVVSLLAGAGIVGVALAFAFQDIAANLLAGIILAFQRPFRIGHLVLINGYEGRVKGIGLRSTKLLIPTGELVELPNRMVIENPLTNYTLMGSRRVDLEVGVSFSEDLPKVKRVLETALKNVKNVGEIEVYFKKFDESAIVVLIRFWIPFKSALKDYYAAQDDAMMIIKQTFDKNNINIPFPIRTLHIEGSNVSEVLKKSKKARR